ncbi:MAG: transcription elongation factor GreB [Porticoccaceae bacterium]|nr:transcription elongation factor GreB [Porticoccaceae bacterium]
MGRYRPPQPKSSPYITAAGAARLEAELKQLWKVERPQVTAAVQEAAKNGDRSENGDYIYGKKRLREIDRRVRYLSKRLENLTVVDRIPDNHSKVFFGAWVTVENSAGEEHRYRIVGADELDPAQNYISVDSPMAKALLGKELDDEVAVSTPSGQDALVIVAIEYQK